MFSHVQYLKNVYFPTWGSVALSTALLVSPIRDVKRPVAIWSQRCSMVKKLISSGNISESYQSTAQDRHFACTL